MWFWRDSQNNESELDSASLDNNICLYSEESSCVSEAAVTTFKVHVHPPMWKLSLGECFKGLYEYLIRAVNNFVYLKTKQNKLSSLNFTSIRVEFTNFPYIYSIFEEL